MKITSNNNYLIKVKYVQICLCGNGGEETDEKKIDMGEGRHAIIHPLPPHLNYNYCLHPLNYQISIHIHGTYVTEIRTVQ